MVGYLFTYFIFISTNDVKLNTYDSMVYTYTRMPLRLADHPQDERFTPHHHSRSRTVRPLFGRINYYYLRGVHSCLKSRIPW